MDDVTIKQKNISFYFSNLKRNSSDGIQDGKIEAFTSIHNKREKKADTVRLGDSTNYTINKYFQFSKDESCLIELKSNLKKLEITSKKNLATVSEFSWDPDNSASNSENKIDRYFKSKRQSLNISELRNSTAEEEHKDKTVSTQEEHKVFSLDHFEVSGESNSKHKIKSKFNNDDTQNNQNNKSNTIFPQKKLFTQNGVIKNQHYEDTKITNWIKHTTYNNLNGLNENICQNILKYLTFKELTQSSIINKTFHNFYKNTINSYFYFNSIDTNKIPTKKEFMEILKKGKNLKHIQKLLEIVKTDFGGEKFGAENFYNKMIVMMTISSLDDLKYRGTLLDSFKIKPKRDCHINNFISNESLIGICQSSKYTLKDLSLRGCYKLTNRAGLSGISLCSFLEKLELSINNNIDDEAVIKIAENCTNLKVLNISNLKSITGKAVKSICLNLRQLEALDLSEDVNVNGDSLYFLQNCGRINRLLLNGIQMRDNDLLFTQNLKELKTLSISSIF
jgi:hypothetical protein